MMNIEHLQLFVRVAATHNISMAGQSLGLSPAVASSHINKLESGLGVRLIHRTTRKVSLTEEGIGFLPHAEEASLVGLKNYQMNSPAMFSSGLPSQQHFETLKAMGITHVIDLIPGDRSEEGHLMDELALNYHNIQVEWKNPTLDNFNEYASKMNEFTQEKGKVLTHCRLNWRGAAFTYLYRVRHLKEDEAIAKADMLKIWQPDETWQNFINKVLQQAQ